MHGNVGEWCADDRRDYTGDPVVNPVCRLDIAAFAVRGGAWIDLPVHARAASRDGRRSGERSWSLGFRFALRSSRLDPEGGV
jgi:formylglycine-generating enzyme required for sulfatase activity